MTSLRGAAIKEVGSKHTCCWSKLEGSPDRDFGLSRLENIGLTPSERKPGGVLASTVLVLVLAEGICPFHAPAARLLKFSSLDTPRS